MMIFACGARSLSSGAAARPGSGPARPWSSTMIPGSDVGGVSRASSADLATWVIVKRGSMAKMASMRNWTSGSSSMTTRILADVGPDPLPSLSSTIESPLVIALASLGGAGSLGGFDLLLQFD